MVLIAMHGESLDSPAWLNRVRVIHQSGWIRLGCPCDRPLQLAWEIDSSDDEPSNGSQVLYRPENQSLTKQSDSPRKLCIPHLSDEKVSHTDMGLVVICVVDVWISDP